MANRYSSVQKEEVPMGKKGLKCLLLVLIFFAGTYMALVGIYRLSTVAIIIMGLIFLGLGIAYLFFSITIPDVRRSNYCGIFSGLFFWAVLGEVVEKLGGIAIADWQMFPLSSWFTFLIALLGIKGYLPTGLLFSLGHFNAVWLLHFVMVNQFELMGRTSWITYPSCAIFVLLAILFGYRMARAETDSENMAYSLALLLVGWTVLEYIWGWRLLPGPWML